MAAKQDAAVCCALRCAAVFNLSGRGSGTLTALFIMTIFSSSAMESAACCAVTAVLAFAFTCAEV